MAYYLPLVVWYYAFFSLLRTKTLIKGRKTAIAIAFWLPYTSVQSVGKAFKLYPRLKPIGGRGRGFLLRKKGRMTDRTNNPEIKTSPEVKFVPEAIAQRCPNCNGYGTLKYGTLTCHSCAGKGYILVPAKEQPQNKTNPDQTFEKKGGG